MKTDYRSLFVDFGIIRVHYSEPCVELVCSPKLPWQLNLALLSCSLIFFRFSSKSVPESLSEMVSSPFFECSSHSSSSSLVMKQHDTN